MQDHTAGNVPGIHFYDEPGLASWRPMPSQARAFQASFGETCPNPKQFDKGNPQDVAAWKKYATWKESFMDAAWKHADWAVTTIQPGWLGATQSQYGWFAFADGYYYNVSRSLPVASGHGGYDDHPPFTYLPPFTLEMTLARDMQRPAWYCPMWFGGHSAESYKAEQNLCFAAGILGSITSPNTPVQDPTLPKDVHDTVLAGNHTYARLSAIFTTMPKTRQPVGLFYSLTSEIQRQVEHNLNYGYPHSEEEDVLDGTLARTCKVLVLTRIFALQHGVVPVLESFIAHGGVVLMTPDCTVSIKGAITQKANPRNIVAEFTAANNAKDEKKLLEIFTTGAMVDAARPIAADNAQIRFTLLNRQ